jgi:PAS domain-containing protein
LLSAGAYPWPTQWKTSALKPTHPLPVHHSWPLYERDRFFELGQLHGGDTLDPVPDLVDVVVPVRPARLGQWQCDLTDDNRLSWSDEVYDIFGIPRGAAVTRHETVALYAEGSRAAMEKLRAYAIKHRRGFTLDVEIRPAQAPRRWMRLIAAPVCAGDSVVRLHGLKFLVPGSDGPEF